jgi:hypothetical protein
VADQPATVAVGGRGVERGGIDIRLADLFASLCCLCRRGVNGPRHVCVDDDPSWPPLPRRHLPQCDKVGVPFACTTLPHVWQPGEVLERRGAQAEPNHTARPRLRREPTYLVADPGQGADNFKGHQYPEPDPLHRSDRARPLSRTLSRPPAMGTVSHGRFTSFLSQLRKRRPHLVYRILGCLGGNAQVNTGSTPR